MVCARKTVTGSSQHQHQGFLWDKTAAAHLVTCAGGTKSESTTVCITARYPSFMKWKMLSG